jgi:hypothetical protein
MLDIFLLILTYFKHILPAQSLLKMYISMKISSLFLTTYFLTKDTILKTQKKISIYHLQAGCTKWGFYEDGMLRSKDVASGQNRNLQHSF